MVQKKTILRKSNDGLVPVRVLQRTARKMLPFYQAIAASQTYAMKWSKAVTTADLDKMASLLRAVSPKINFEQLGSNSIGYFVAFPSGDPRFLLTNGTTILPGSTQSVFEVRIHRAIARAVLPLYLKLARDCSFAAAFNKAVGMGNDKVVRQMVRSVVRTRALISIGTGVEEGGVSLTFKYNSTEFIYRNLLFLDTV
ncbi:hypothetical protein FHS18_001688 [Paenibacillus phyllosphaerae]|uniref:Uncharacterized protein n=1 Tax=Paenibacillus phyllosphaerae TaxID=274593 RepID=A0A7W5AVN1_9BACL|nr:hypothetical protein [Paenibacillus phyllosphaerae]MBB3109625.1 hypothetical protein [Paenibacillus phyllosphaerae]